jgi:hypothetical protein
MSGNRFTLPALASAVLVLAALALAWFMTPGAPVRENGDQNVRADRGDGSAGAHRPSGGGNVPSADKRSPVIADLADRGKTAGAMGQAAGATGKGAVNGTARARAAGGPQRATLGLAEKEGGLKGLSARASAPVRGANKRTGADGAAGPERTASNSGLFSRPSETESVPVAAMTAPVGKQP